MQNEPIVVGQILNGLALLTLVYSPLGDVVAAFGGEAAVATVATGIIGVITWFRMRAKVSPE